jgi:hypothetical protein
MSEPVVSLNAFISADVGTRGGSSFVRAPALIIFLGKSHLDSRSKPFIKGAHLSSLLQASCRCSTLKLIRLSLFNFANFIRVTCTLQALENC